MDDLVFILAITLKSSIPVLLASLGEIVTERSGILNLGLEGMMLMGALAGFVVGQQSGSLPLGFAGAMAAGMLLALIHAFFCIHLHASQVICGLAITILATGLSSFLGRPFIGRVGLHLDVLPVGTLAAIPLVGPILAQQNWLSMATLLLVPLTAWVLAGSWPGLYIRAVGEDPEVAHAAGVPVVFIRYACTLFGGILAGLGGAYLSLVYTPGWKEGMTGGQGWIAIAMVIFATWRPGRALYGALLFGGLTAVQFYFQATGNALVPAWILRLLPYLLTVGILFLVTAIKRTRLGTSPAALGQPFSLG